MQESGLAEIIPLICFSALQGQYPVFSHLESRGLLLGRLQQLITRRGVDTLPPSRVPPGLAVGGCNGMAWKLQHPLITHRAGALHLLGPSYEVRVLTPPILSLHKDRGFTKSNK